MARDFKRMKLTGKDRVWGLALAVVTIVIGIVYQFGLYGPDIYGSRAWLKDFDPIGYAPLVWVVTAFCVMLDGPYGAYAKNGREDKEA